MLPPLEKELWRFRQVANEVHAMLRGFHNTPDVAATINADLLFALSNQGLLQVCKFLEIWDDFGRLAKRNPRVKLARRIAQPAIDRMRVWPGLDLFRNTALAHPYTTPSGALVRPADQVASGRVPSFHAEIVLLLTPSMQECRRF